MCDLEHARQMLSIAKRDLKALGGMLDAETFAYEIFGFHAQQTAEKALKAWISALGGTYGFTHDLGLLLNSLGNLGADCSNYSELLDLTIFAVHFRYDDAGDDSGFPEREEILERLSALVARVEDVLK
ncbi:MAG: HEPN domain-containing protein [Desulfuromonadales bacterium]|nr:HEPN domain-containing protein [Desulfuromonadales bacterium]